MRILLLLILFLNPLFFTQVKAQIKSQKKAHNNSKFNTLKLNLNSSDVDFNFRWFSDYKNGLGGYGSQHNISGQIQASINWKLEFRSQGQFKQRNGRRNIPLNNIAITASYSGSGKVYNRARTNPIALSSRSKTILSSYYSSNDFKKGDKNNSKGNNGIGHAYGKDKNKKKITDQFILYFEMGTQKPGMYPTSLYNQNLPSGTYSVNINFIVCEKL